ncbi:hypothetical protein LXL04_034952 [Taraxacum kok-saghyz]
MNRNRWMYKFKRLNDKYLAGLDGFLKFVEENRVKMGVSYIWCPCRDCKIVKRKIYLIVRGFMRDYTCWSRHGDILVDCGVVASNLNEVNDDSNNVRDDNLSEVLFDCEDDVAQEDYEKN